jgi:predicted regulator of Ras-like GTPase activity (Roadblock/LC7/MglB family)
VAETAQALADLTEISAQIEAVVVFDREGTVLASTLDDERAGRLAATALDLLRAAEDDAGQKEVELVQLDVALHEGSVFVVRDDDRLIAATTAPEPTVGLVFYDLKSCLRGLGETKTVQRPTPKRAPVTRATPRPGKKDEKP